MNIIIINGPNLNLLGKREKEIYGEEKFDSFFKNLQSGYPDVNMQYFQSNNEGIIIDKIHEIGFSYHGIIINAGAFTHTSLAIRDAIAGVEAAKRAGMKCVAVTTTNPSSSLGDADLVIDRLDEINIGDLAKL